MIELPFKVIIFKRRYSRFKLNSKGLVSDFCLKALEKSSLDFLHPIYCVNMKANVGKYHENFNFYRYNFFQ